MMKLRVYQVSYSVALYFQQNEVMFGGPPRHMPMTSELGLIRFNSSRLIVDTNC